MVSFLFNHALEPPLRPQSVLPTTLAMRCLTKQVSEAWCQRERHAASSCPPTQPRPLFPLQVRIWEIPEGGLKRNMTEALLELHGHSRRVGLVEWHPTTNNILFSAGYDYKVGSPAGSGNGAGERRASSGACRKHCHFPEHVDQYCLICSFIHSLHTTEHLLCTHHSRGSQRLEGTCLLWCWRTGVNATPCPLSPGGEKRATKAAGGKRMEPQPLPSGVPSKEVCQLLEPGKEHLSFLLVVETEPRLDLWDRDASAFDSELNTVLHPSTPNPARGTSPRTLGCRLGTDAL